MSVADANGRNRHSRKHVERMTRDSRKHVRDEHLSDAARVAKVDDVRDKLPQIGRAAHSYRGKREGEGFRLSTATRTAYVVSEPVSRVIRICRACYRIDSPVLSDSVHRLRLAETSGISAELGTP